MRMASLRSILLLTFAGIAQAQAPAPAPDPAPAPAPEAPIPPKEPPPATDENVPTVTIRTTESGDRVEEYRQNGQVFMVKVTPKNGVPYTLYDDNMDGRLDRSDAEKNDISPVYYTIYEWN